MRPEEVRTWFDKIRRFTSVPGGENPFTYISESSGLISLPDHSRSTSDLIMLVATRISTEGIYDIFTCSLPNRRCFSATYPIPDAFVADVHSHNYMELAFVLCGTMYIRFGDTTETFEAGEICLIRQGLLHADFLKCNDTIILYLGINDRFFDQAFFSDADGRASNTFLRDIIVKKRMAHDFVRFIPKHPSAVIPFLYLQILEEMFRLEPGHLHLVEGYCERILYLLPAEYQITLTDVERSEYSFYLYKDVKAYIEEHYAAVSTKVLSEQFGYNQDYFNRLIKKFSGRTYTQLLQDTRIKAAASLLETSTLSIETISQMVGYSNLGYFYRAFQAAYGCRPREYRRRTAAETSIMTRCSTL